MKLVIFEAEPWEKEPFRESCEDQEVVYVREALTEESASEYADAQIVSTFIYSDLSRDVLSKLEALELVATRSTGYDHIDIGYCEENGVVVCNVPEYGDNTVAEHVFALLLALFRKLPDAVDRTRKGDFSMRGLRGRDLGGKTLGVVGTGSIGEHVIRIARGFDMAVLAFDVSQDVELERDLGFEYVELERLLRESDVVTLHIPGGEKTRDFLSDDEFALMKEGAVIINTSRGTVLDTRALLRALSEGGLAGAGLDVLDEEPTIREEAELIRSVFRKEHDLETLLADHVLMHMRNVIVTPHIGFDTEEAVSRIVETTVENIQSYCSGQPTNVVAGPSGRGSS